MAAQQHDEIVQLVPAKRARLGFAVEKLLRAMDLLSDFHGKRARSVFTADIWDDKAKVRDGVIAICDMKALAHDETVFPGSKDVMVHLVETLQKSMLRAVCKLRESKSQVETMWVQLKVILEQTAATSAKEDCSPEVREIVDKFNKNSSSIQDCVKGSPDSM